MIVGKKPIIKQPHYYFLLKNFKKTSVFEQWALDVIYYLAVIFILIMLLEICNFILLKFWKIDKNRMCPFKPGVFALTLLTHYWYDHMMIFRSVLLMDLK